jgi:hypothetical protein
MGNSLQESAVDNWQSKPRHEFGVDIAKLVKASHGFEQSHDRMGFEITVSVDKEFTEYETPEIQARLAILQWAVYGRLYNTETLSEDVQGAVENIVSRLKSLSADRDIEEVQVTAAKINSTLTSLSE